MSGPLPGELPILLDRLVDGELPADARRQLLRRLEAEPEGWRDCALAFLEAQAIRESLKELDDDLRASRPQTVAAAEIPSRPQRLAATPRRFDMLGMCLAAAASFLIAFFLGVNSGGYVTMPGVSAPAGSLASSRPTAAVAATPVEWSTLPVSVDANGTTHEMRVPVAAGPGAVTLLEEQPRRLPAALERHLRRQGYEVNYDRELLEMPLDDGRRAVLPVDNVDVEFVGDRRIQ